MFGKNVIALRCDKCMVRANRTFFCVEIIMEKTKQDKYKDYLRTKDKQWVDVPQSNRLRKCSSGVTFGGVYIKKV